MWRDTTGGLSDMSWQNYVRLAPEDMPEAEAPLLAELDFFAQLEAIHA